MFFYPALTMFRTGKDEPEWEGFMDYYHPDLSPYFYYFDSWEHLKQIILSPNPIDTKNVRVEGPKFYDRVRDKTLRGWADLIGSLGFSIPFNGKVAPFPPDLIDAPYRPRLPDVKVPRPSDMEDVFPRVREWRLNEEERFRQIRKVQYMRLTHLELSALQYRKWMQEKIPDGMLVDFPKEHDGMDSLLFHLNEVIDGLMRSGSDAKQSMGVFDATTVEWARNATASVKKYEKISPQGYRTFAQMARIARFSHSALQFVSSSKDQKLLAMKAPLKESLKTSVRIAYPWLLSKMYKTMDDLTGSFSGRGIVFVIEDDGYDRVLQTIAHLRKNLACDLPIEVFYNGDYHHDDPNGSFQRGDIRLKEQRRLDLASISNVTTRDIHHAYDKFWEQSGTTEHARSFAIVASKFAEAIVIHEDTVLLQNPDTIVSDSERFKSDGVYMQQGPLSDESGHSQWVSWFLGGEKFVSEASKSGRYFRNVTRHEMNAGFMAFDKKRVSVLHGLLVASFLNSEDARKENFDWFLDTTKGKGEQETYWIGMELAQAPYKFVNNAVGLVAQASTNSEVCGPIVYLDENGAPIRLQSKAWDFSKLSEVDMVYQLQEDDTKVAVSERNGLFCLNGSKGTGRVSPIGVNGTLGFEETVAAAKGMLKIANVRKSKNLKKFFQS
ncbi:mannosyltransferase putative-domain-containing protein [Chytriomyces sp. MP71]|nr:mannosyltransferase putative-domain-containing protein [Chytriomyces sp. MP71]